jgi:hypothetical protein
MAVFLARAGVELRQRGCELSEIAIVIGTTVSLDLVVGVVVVLLMRRLKRVRAEPSVR